MPRNGAPVLVTMLALCASGCAKGTAASSVQIDGARAFVDPSTESQLVAGLQLTQPGRASVLVGARPDSSGVATLTVRVFRDGRPGTETLEELPLPKGRAVMLKPSGVHIAVRGLARVPSPGDVVTLTLMFGDGSERAVRFPVRAPPSVER